MRRNLILSAIAAASVGLLMACPTDDGSGSTITQCTADTDCSATELCHPVGKICVPTCEAAADCPATAKNCEEIKDAAGTALTTKKVCKCSTTPLCNEDGSDTLVCSPVDNICETKCAADTDCADFAGRKCDTATGVCILGGDCSPACTGDQICDPATKKCIAKCTAATCTTAAAPKCDTGTGLCGKCTAAVDCSGRADGMTECDTASGACKAPACNTNNPTPGTAGGPDICAYGQVCPANGACQDIAKGTCTGAANYTWNKSAQGPVIVSVVTTGSATSDTTSECGNGGPKLEAVVTFYAPKGFTHGGAADLINNRVRFLKADGTELGAAFVKNAPSSGAKTGTFTGGSCGTQDKTNRAIFLKDQSGNAGNAACL